MRLAFEGDVADAFTSLGIAHVVEKRADNCVVLDRGYCPPCLDILGGRMPQGDGR